MDSSGLLEKMLQEALVRICQASYLSSGVQEGYFYSILLLNQVIKANPVFMGGELDTISQYE